MKIVISTQVLEWYGDDEVINGRWKPKGGNDYIIANVPLDLLMQGYEAIATHVELATTGVIPTYKKGDTYQEWMIDWSIEEDDFLTHSEQLQLEYDGRIDWPAKVILDHAVPDDPV